MPLTFYSFINLYKQNKSLKQVYLNNLGILLPFLLVTLCILAAAKLGSVLRQHRSEKQQLTSVLQQLGFMLQLLGSVLQQYGSMLQLPSVGVPDPDGVPALL